MQVVRIVLIHKKWQEQKCDLSMQCNLSHKYAVRFDYLNEENEQIYLLKETEEVTKSAKIQ